MVGTPSFRLADLEHWSTAVLTQAGLTPDHAAAVTESLLFAECRGIPTHGLIRLGVYTERILAGGINAGPTIRVVAESSATAIVDADNAIGAPAANFAADLCGEKAKQYGIAMVVVRKGNHFGAAGLYAKRLASKGQIGVVGCNSDKVMAPPGGGIAIVGSNPLAIALPRTGAGVESVLDMAASQATLGRLLVAQQRGQSIPTGWAVDPQGWPTNDPGQGLAGALLPAAGPKGFGLAFMIDILATLGGAALSSTAGALYGPRDRPQNVGFFFIGVDPNHFLGLEAVTSATEQLRAHIKGAGLPGSTEPPMIPGEPEQRHEETVGTNIELNEALVADLQELSERYEVAFPSPAL
jgi:LDH2 family malate/lactate/ureidoglycolate dehydrogenase